MRPFVPDTFLAKKKGDLITPAELAPVVGCGPENSKYSLRLATLADTLMKMRRAAGDPVTVAQQKNSLKLLTDAEASVYLGQKNDQAVRLVFRSNRGLREVRVSELTESQLHDHDRRLVIGGAREAVLRNVTRSMKPTAHRRILPGAMTEPGRS